MHCVESGLGLSDDTAVQKVTAYGCRSFGGSAGDKLFEQLELYKYSPPRQVKLRVTEAAGNGRI